MKQCTTCDIFTSDIEPKCPKCGGALIALLSAVAKPVAPKPASNSNAMGCFVLLGILLLIAIVSHWLSDDKAPGPSATAIPEKPCLELVSDKATLENSYGHIHGVVRNNCDKRFRYVEIEFKLYDSADAVTGTAMTNVTALGPYESWRFDAVGLHPFRQYNLAHVRGSE